MDRSASTHTADEKREKRFRQKPDFIHGDVAGQVEPGEGFINLDVDNVLTVSEATSLRDWLNEVLP